MRTLVSKYENHQYEVKIAIEHYYSIKIYLLRDFLYIRMYQKFNFMNDTLMLNFTQSKLFITFDMVLYLNFEMASFSWSNPDSTPRALVARFAFSRL